MKREMARDLLRSCSASKKSGDDFPTIWETILRRHPLILGPPVSTIKGGRTCLEMYLVTGQRLVFDSESQVFSLS
jgi:hypothetical protein